MGIRLWVDDIRNPKNHRPGEEWHWAKTVTEAIRILHSSVVPVDEISIDYDISMKVFIDDGEARPFASKETFEPVACYLALLAGSFDAPLTIDGPVMPRVTIHSASAVGIGRMSNIFNDAGVKYEVRKSKPCNRWEEESSGV